jgi:MFS family permease
MRLLMGVFEGAYTPVSIAATTEASKPERRGLNIGIQLGFFGAAGQISMGAISDHIGRRLTLNVSFALAIVFLFLLTRTGADPLLLFLLLGGLSACAFAILGLLSGPVVTEAVPVTFMASGAGIPTGVAEIFGGGVMPIIAGAVAQHFGIQHTLSIGLFGLAAGLVLSFFLRETAPKLKR